MGNCELPFVYQHLKAVTLPENCLYCRKGFRGEKRFYRLCSEVVEGFKHTPPHTQTPQPDGTHGKHEEPGLWRNWNERWSEKYKKGYAHPFSFLLTEKKKKKSRKHLDCFLSLEEQGKRLYSSKNLKGYSQMAREWIALGWTHRRGAHLEQAESHHLCCPPRSCLLGLSCTSGQSCLPSLGAPARLGVQKISIEETVL